MNFRRALGTFIKHQVAFMSLSVGLLLGACSANQEQTYGSAGGRGGGSQSSGGTVNGAGGITAGGVAAGGRASGGASGAASAAGGAGGSTGAGAAGTSAADAGLGGGASGSPGSAAGGGRAGQGSGGSAGLSGAGASGGGSGGSAGAASPIPSAERTRLMAIQKRALALQANIVGFWKQHGPDAQGGFHGALDRQGNATSATTKFVHVEARHLWSFSAWYRLKEPTAEVRAICDDLLAFLDKFYDSGNGRYSYAVTRDGSSVVDAKKMLYAQSFVILALSEYALAFDNKGARDKALALFQAIETDHDAANGGYDQQNDAWSFSSNSARKSMNVHMHLMESYTLLYRATENAVVRQRLSELTNLFRTKVVQPQRYYHTEFDLAWNPVASPAVVEYGHDLQIFWQVVNALEALGMASDRAALTELATIAEEGAAKGLDGQNGYATEGTPGGSRRTGNKVWWVQAEALNGLLRLYLVSGNVVNLDRIETTLGFVERAFLDADYGELYTETTSAGSASDTRKGYEWKASYHALRFALQLDLWIAEALA